MAQVEADQQHTCRSRQPIRQAKANVLGQRQQQQVEERQRNTNEDVLHRVHTQIFQHFEQEKAGKGQRDEQQRVFDRPLALQVLVHRVDEAHTEGTLAEIGALPGVRALA
ncbi:hypothetical protein D3C80_1477480 [compost metagenome]